jgi:Spy/CpxP family protein refolding chaperone
MINNQNKSKIFLVIIAILLVANIAMLTFFLQKKEPVDKGRRPDRKAMIAEFLQKEIGFTTQQLAQYDSLSNQQQEKMKALFDTMRSNKTQQFKQLAAVNFTDSAINTVADQSAAAQKIMELQMYNHIKAVRALCTPQQQPAFDSLFVKVFNRRGEARKKTTK